MAFLKNAAPAWVFKLLQTEYVAHHAIPGSPRCHRALLSCACIVLQAHEPTQRTKARRVQKLLQSLHRTQQHMRVSQLQVRTLGKAESGEDKCSCGNPISLCAHEQTPIRCQEGQ